MRRGRRTWYHGTWFRSQLEARWAAYFDMVHTPWRYEHDGFEFEDESSYLPDFLLPGLRTYIEVKPVSVDATSAGKALKLAFQTATTVHFAIGTPAWAFDEPSGQLVRFTPTGKTFYGFRFAECERSGLLRISEDGSLGSFPCHAHKESEVGHTTARLFTATMVSRLLDFEV